MSDNDNKDNQLWYTRRNDVVKGPFPEPLVSSYILLGRLNEMDELSPDGKHWGGISKFPQLIPDVMKNVRTEDDRLRLELARMRVDERMAEKRLESQRAKAREAAEAEWAGEDERRQGERRRPESDTTIRHRQYRKQLLDEMGGRAIRKKSLLLPLVLLLICTGLVFAFYLLWQELSIESASEPDCSTAPGPDINWSYCQMQGRVLARQDMTGAILSNVQLQGGNLQSAKLSGANLDYAELGGANLGFADLSRSSLRGAVLVQANLSGANLSGADLAYADLKGANLNGTILEGANLSKAYWVDGQICANGSVGQCLK